MQVTLGKLEFEAGIRFRSRKRDPDRKEEKRQNRAIRIVFLVLSVPALVGLILLFASTHPGLEKFSVGLLTAAASFAAGALLGFLFGIPRYLATQSATPATASAPTNYSPNTNLEQISDWLTKILVGVGLVQIGQIGHSLSVLGSGVEKGLGKDTQSIAITLIIAFTIAGFMTSYLFTRLRLQTVLEPLKEALKKQEDDLTSALPLVREQLDPSGEKDPTQIELSKALYVASSGIRDEAFYLARNQRRANWRGDPEKREDKALVDLVIPVFQTLVDLDVDQEYHRNCGELGYAYKDREKPKDGDYRAAVANLTEAIRRRDLDQVMSGAFPLYEFNRAFANIKLEEGKTKAKKKSQASRAAQIKADLEVAKNAPKGAVAIKENKKLIDAWRRANPDPK